MRQLQLHQQLHAHDGSALVELFVGLVVVFFVFVRLELRWRELVRWWLEWIVVMFAPQLGVEPAAIPTLT